jgi:CheY-like chemotaxis protein
MTAADAVLVLVTETFFRDRIETTLRAVGREPVLVDPAAEDMLEKVLASGALGLVIDLEDESCDAPTVLEALRADERTASWHFVGFSAHEDDDLMARGAAAGVEVVPRSTFAANLVRLMQSFQPPEVA